MTPAWFNNAMLPLIERMDNAMLPLIKRMDQIKISIRNIEIKNRNSLCNKNNKNLYPLVREVPGQGFDA